MTYTDRAPLSGVAIEDQWYRCDYQSVSKWCADGKVRGVRKAFFSENTIQKTDNYEENWTEIQILVISTK